MAKNTGLRWRGRPLEKDFAAAAGFLSLIYPTARGHRLLAALRRATMVRHPAKDLLRASRLPLLPSDEWHVEMDLRRIRKGKALSPVLLIRGNLARCEPLVVADGYHRICAVCHYDETSPVACVLAGD